MSVDCTQSSDNSNLTISIVDRFDFESVQELRAAYADKRDLNYIIDMDATEHMDSSALGRYLI